MLRRLATGLATPAVRRLVPAAKAAPLTRAMSAVVPFNYEDLFQLDANPVDVPYKKLTSDYVSTIDVDGEEFLKVEPEALTLLAEHAMTDIAHLLRPAHLQQLSNILDDPEASENDRFVALELLKNANIAASMVLPGCQDTGTAIVAGKRGQRVITGGSSDEEALSKGVYNTYTTRNLRYSQVAPLDMFTEVNTKSNLPAQIELYVEKRRGKPTLRGVVLCGVCTCVWCVWGCGVRVRACARGCGVRGDAVCACAHVLCARCAVRGGARCCILISLRLSFSPPRYATEGDEYKFMFIAKGGGSANKTFLYQQTKALLNPDSLMEFIHEKIQTLGTSACPPYHLAVCIGGLSAEMTLKTVKYASCKYLDGLPTEGSDGGRAFRDVEWEEKIHQMSRDLGIGAQFGGKYFCHDVRVVRLPRHGASCPVAIGVSCSADRQAFGKITKDGVFLEQLETEPSKYDLTAEREREREDDERETESETESETDRG